MFKLGNSLLKFTFQTIISFFSIIFSIIGSLFGGIIDGMRASKKNRPKQKPRESISSKERARPKTIKSSTDRSTSLARIDQMSGHEFEQFTADLLQKLGYERVEVTPGSGDQGVDVIAVRDGKRYAIQCKRYSKKLGNKPVQEVYAGKTIYGCSVAVVLTNNYFTEGAKEAARSTGVELWDRDTLQRMMDYAKHMSMRTLS